MNGEQHFGWSRWRVVLGRSLVVGAMSGLLGGALIFFLFGFVGFAGASFPARIENGWEAALDPGLSKGLVSGLGIAIGLGLISAIWTILAGGFDPSRARPWLAGLAAVVVVLSNLGSLRRFDGWDDVGIVTVLGIALVVGGIVWIVTPWVFGSRHWGGSSARTMTGFEAE